MITCECGVQLPYPELREVFCERGIPKMGYDQPYLVRADDEGYTVFEPCPCPCHLAQESDAPALVAVVASLDEVK